MIRNLTLAALSVALLAPIAQAQTTTTTTTRVQGGASDVGTSAAGTSAVSDQLFAQAAAIGGLTELQISELGVQKATDPELKKFSQQMIEEHTKMNSELMALASRKQVALPRTVDPRAAFCAQSLAGLSGEKFDACYAKAQCVVHEDSVATFEAEAERGQDPDMKALAAKSLPHIKEHLKMIKPIAQRYEEKMKAEKGEK